MTSMGSHSFAIDVKPWISRKAMVTRSWCRGSTRPTACLKRPTGQKPRPELDKLPLLGEASSMVALERVLRLFPDRPLLNPLSLSSSRATGLGIMENSRSLAADWLRLRSCSSRLWASTTLSCSLLISVISVCTMMAIFSSGWAAVTWPAFWGAKSWQIGSFPDVIIVSCHTGGCSFNRLCLRPFLEMHCWCRRVTERRPPTTSSRNLCIADSRSGRFSL
mmetsp:Transcript_4856/g.13621  ORF Transcript_4856/g.13621 Transcript_4856/m.13621 type:complete len:220 (-) Transcript_4856:770-1429(-)